MLFNTMIGYEHDGQMRRGAGGVSLASAPTATQAKRHWQQRGATSGDVTTSCDVAFLAHPGVILSAFARWMPEKRPLQR